MLTVTLNDEVLLINAINELKKNNIYTFTEDLIYDNLHLNHQVITEILGNLVNSCDELSVNFQMLNPNNLSEIATFKSQDELADYIDNYYIFKESGDKVLIDNNSQVRIIYKLNIN